MHAAVASLARFRSNGHRANGRTPNGHTENGHTENGHTPNGHTPNGHTGNGHTDTLGTDTGQMATITKLSELERLIRATSASTAPDSAASDSAASDSAASDQQSFIGVGFGVGHRKGRLLVGITGSPGAGKTTIGERLVADLGPEAQLLSMDGFHLPQARLVELGRRERMGAPDTFDVAGFVLLLRELRADNTTVLIPEFDREREEAGPNVATITRDIRIVVVEGNYLLVDDPETDWSHVAPILDVTFFVDIDDDTRLRRLIARHERFGKSPAEARAWSLGPDAANAAIIDRTAARADHRVRLG